LNPWHSAGWSDREQKSKWEKLDDQENWIEGGLQRIVTYKWDTVGLTIVQKYMHSRVVLTFINNKLTRIDIYSKDKELLDQNVQELLTTRFERVAKTETLTRALIAILLML
jgi:hypothetical protein